MTRFYVVFTSSFRSDTAPCISHETVDQHRTLCGRLVSSAATLEPDNNDLEPDCNVCRAAAMKLRGAGLREEAQLKCKTCSAEHAAGALQPRCFVTGCECWCNR